MFFLAKFDGHNSFQCRTVHKVVEIFSLCSCCPFELVWFWNVPTWYRHFHRPKILAGRAFSPMLVQWIKCLILKCTHVRCKSLSQIFSALRNVNEDGNTGHSYRSPLNLGWIWAGLLKFGLDHGGILCGNMLWGACNGITRIVMGLSGA